MRITQKMKDGLDPSLISKGFIERVPGSVSSVSNESHDETEPI